MDKKPLIVKWLAIGIILLFVATCIIPVIAQNIEKPLPTPRGSWLYVGGSGPGNYSIIQYAINDANPGDTIFVYDESSPYFENIRIDKSLTLVGEDKTTTKIDGNGNDVVITVTLCSHVNIHGFTIKNGDQNLIRLDSCERCSISENILFGRDCLGIFLSKSHNNELLNNIIIFGSGILSKYCINNTIAHNNISFAMSGIVLFDSPDTKIYWNHVKYIYYNGLEIEGSSNCDIYGNIIEKNRGNGIYFYRCSNNTVRFNTIKRNTVGVGIDGNQINFYSNNFINNICKVVITEIGDYYFDSNYFNRPLHHPKCIIGLKQIMLRAPGTHGPHDPGWFITIPKLIFDANPAQEPYDIPG